MADDRRVILFDLDGCLVDSTVPIRSCLDAAFEEHGVPPIPPDGLRRHIGPPLQVTLSELVAEHGLPGDLVDDLVTAYRSRYATVSVDLAISYPGVPELVAKLAADGHRVGVVTSKPQRFAVPIIEALDLDRHYEVIVGPELTEAEPKTATLARALEKLDTLRPVDRSRSVMIGDRHHDIDAAREHGLTGIGVLWGFGDREELEAAGATAIVATADELADVLRDLDGADQGRL